MIANWSRVSQFGKCQEKAWNWDERKLDTWSPALPLLQGGGFHDGVAKYFATHDSSIAAAEVEASIRRELEGKMVLPEEKPDIDRAIAWSSLAVKKFAASYEQQPIQVLWPEVQFMVPLPRSHHHCWFMHRHFCKNTEYPACPVERMIRENHGVITDKVIEHCAQWPCFQPHWFRGKTDAVVSLDGQIFLFEHKTNSMKMEMFIQKYFLDAQATGYIYGIQRQLGVPVAGFVLNVIQKPHPNMKDQMQVGFAREMFFRDPEDMQAFEGEFTQEVTNYENAFRDRALGNQFAVTRRTTACTDYGRKCPYFDMCQRHPREPLEGEFDLRSDDYVDKAYLEVYNKWKETQQQ